MQELLDQVRYLLQGLWIHRWISILIAWLVCLIGWPFVLKVPDQFESQAKVYVDTQSLLSPLLRGLTIQTNASQQVQLIVKTLFTRPNLEKIARLSDLDIQAENNEQFELLIGQLKNNLKLDKADRENIYSIAYQSSSPEQAKNVVQATLTTLVENTLGDKREDSDVAAGFIDRQIEEYEKRLRDADNRLKEFKKDNYELMSSDGGYYARIERLKSTIASVELELKEAKTRRDSIARQLAGEEPSFGLMPDSLSPQFGISSSFDGRIETLENKLDELRLKYTDIHPDIKETQRIIDDLKNKRDVEIEQRRQEMQAYNDQTGGGSLNQNPVYQELKLSLAREESNVSSLTVRRNTYSGQLKELQSKINSIPDIEADLKALERGYQVTQQKYNELLSRRESARLSQEAEVSADSFQFRIIDPPRIPSAPIGPNRPLFLSLVLAAGVGVGLGIAFVISQVQPVFLSSRQLNSVTGFPVLGSISIYHNHDLKKRGRKRALLFAILSAALLLLFIGILLLQLFPKINQQVTHWLPDLPTKLNLIYLQLKQLVVNLVSRF